MESKSASTHRVFDVVETSFDGSPEGRGVVAEVRRYVNGDFRYSVVPLDPEDDLVGGIYDESQLAPTGGRSHVERFWTGALRSREVVQVAQTHPAHHLRGRLATVRSLDSGLNEEETYGIEIALMRDDDLAREHEHDVPGRFLEGTGHRLPADPVPRPVITWHPGIDNNLRPSWEFDLIDEVEQYL